MLLTSTILAGVAPNARLERAAAGAPSIKQAPPADDAEAVRRIQLALVALGFPLPRSFPDGPGKPPDGKYGDETYRAVVAFQKKVFPTNPGEWDGRVGKNTLARIDALLPTGGGSTPPSTAPAMAALATRDRATSIQWTQAAIQRLTEARNFVANPPPGPLPGFPPITPLTVALTFVALEVHFHISTATIPVVQYIDAVTDTFRKTLNVLNNPATFFVDDTTSAEAAKGTPAHVPFGSGKVNFTPSFRERSGTTGFGPMCRAAMVLHEPIHVVDHPAASFAVNHVHENSPKYATQPAMNQLHNAHSYPAFGQQAFFWIDTRFGAGKPDQ